MNRNLDTNLVVWYGGWRKNPSVSLASPPCDETDSGIGKRSPLQPPYGDPFYYRVCC